MQQPSVVHSTFVIERSYPKPPAIVFSAFADPITLRRWFAESDTHDVEEFASDFRVGGIERFRYRFKEGSRFPGVPLGSEGTYQDIVTDKRIVTASAMTLGEHRISASQVTFEFLATEAGTDLLFTHQGVFFENADGPQRREGGWRTLFEKLAAELAP